MTRDEYLKLDDEELFRVCRMERFRSSGPGGQHRNKTDSAVRLTLEEDSSISAEADESRSQHQNRTAALQRLRLAIAYAMRSDAEPGAWTGQLKFNMANREYPVFVARVLDALAQQEWRVGDAARALGLSTGKLNRALFRDHQLWAHVNRERQRAGFAPLRAPK